jgi:hypothetical protein
MFELAKIKIDKAFGGKVTVSSVMQEINNCCIVIKLP